MFAKGAPCYAAAAAGSTHGGHRVRVARAFSLLALEAYWQRISRVYDRVDCFIAPAVFVEHHARRRVWPRASV
jgi:hypothetical protein